MSKRKLMPRKEAQEILGINIQAIKRLEKAKYLTPIKQHPELHYSNVYYQIEEFEKYYELITNPKVA